MQPLTCVVHRLAAPALLVGCVLITGCAATGTASTPTAPDSIPEPAVLVRTIAPEPEPEVSEEEPNNSPEAAVASDLGPGESVEVQVGDTPIVIRRKLHIAEPMSIDEALYEMELIGHDFFLFVNKETGRPSVVYHRHGWSYGVFEIDTPENIKNK